jgi:hypothetical protein
VRLHGNLLGTDYSMTAQLLKDVPARKLKKVTRVMGWALSLQFNSPADGPWMSAMSLNTGPLTGSNGIRKFSSPAHVCSCWSFEAAE